jgi:decaprenylphospho-beta-D-erythro-pentofuranosid-2-ulose 2-reductase|tara:strand:+ start:400 stop:1143 length:744 start_codon:yes stop_codon:yes gene_type:complete
MKRFIIIGATSSIAEHCARLWIAEAPINLTLVGRDASRTKSIADDLKVRSPGSAITVVSGNLVEPESIQRLVNQILKDGNADCALIAHGSLADQSACQQDLALTAEELSINGISPVLFAEAIANSMVRAGHGTLGVIGSVAGDRGRKSNYVYGAGKGLVARYAQGLQHRLAGTGVTVTLIKPGPTRTPMTAHLGDSGPSLADVAKVAATIVSGMEKRRNVVYAPRRWWVIMMIIRHLPRFIFNKMDI